LNFELTGRVFNQSEKPGLELLSGSTRITNVSLTNESITLRPVTPEDAAFLREVYKSSRGDDLRGLGWDEPRINEFLEMQYDAQRIFETTDHKAATDEIILCEGESAGRLCVESRDTEIRCHDLALLPNFRNRGIGTLLLRRLQSQATKSRRSLGLQVLRFNRSVSLFERLGFVRTSESGSHLQMEWKPTD